MKLFMNVVDWKRHSLKKNKSIKEVDICGCDFNISQLRNVVDKLLMEIILVCSAAMEEHVEYVLYHGVNTDSVNDVQRESYKSKFMEEYINVFMNDQNILIAFNHIYKHLMKGLIDFETYKKDDTMYVCMKTYSYTRDNTFSFLGIKTDMKVLRDSIPYEVEFIFKRGGIKI